MSAAWTQSWSDDVCVVLVVLVLFGNASFLLVLKLELSVEAIPFSYPSGIPITG
jgi:hypothetical protein